MEVGDISCWWVMFFYFCLTLLPHWSVLVSFSTAPTLLLVVFLRENIPLHRKCRAVSTEKWSQASACDSTGWTLFTATKTTTSKKNSEVFRLVQRFILNIFQHRMKASKQKTKNNTHRKKTIQTKNTGTSVLVFINSSPKCPPHGSTPQSGPIPGQGKDVFPPRNFLVVGGDFPEVKIWELWKRRISRLFVFFWGENSPATKGSWRIPQRIICF